MRSHSSTPASGSRSRKKTQERRLCSTRYPDVDLAGTLSDLCGNIPSLFAKVEGGLDLRIVAITIHESRRLGDIADTHGPLAASA